MITDALSHSAVPSRPSSLPDTSTSDVAATASLSIAVHRWTEWDDLRPYWRALFAESPYRSIVLSPEWIEAWLGVFGEQLNPEILLFRDAATVAGACLLVRKRVRVGCVRIRRTYLNTSGEDAADEAFTEFNDLLVTAGHEQAAARALRAHLDRHRWDEFVIDGFRDSLATAALLGELRDRRTRRHATPARYVDLDLLRSSGHAYSYTLSQKARYNIRQSLKLYEQTGPLQIRSASSTDEAVGMLGELAAFHERRWEARQGGGAFRSTRFVAFHTRLIQLLHGTGGVRLARVTAGERTLGLVYSLVLDGVEHFYQCGFNYEDHKRLRPGLVTLFLAITDAANSGLREFNLMAGDTEYKRTLAKENRELHWITVDARTVRVRALATIRAARRVLTSGARAQDPPTKDH